MNVPVWVLVGFVVFVVIVGAIRVAQNRRLDAVLKEMESADASIGRSLDRIKATNEALRAGNDRIRTALATKAARDSYGHRYRNSTPAATPATGTNSDHTTRHRSDSPMDDFMASAAVAAATNNMAVGMLIGGNPLGAFVGEAVAPDAPATDSSQRHASPAPEPESCRPQPSSYEPCAPCDTGSISGFESSGSCDSSPSSWSE